MSNNKFGWSEAIVSAFASGAMFGLAANSDNLVGRALFSVGMVAGAAIVVLAIFDIFEED